VPPIGGVVSFTNVMLRVLIREAYQVDPYTERYTLISGPYEIRRYKLMLGRITERPLRSDVVYGERRLGVRANRSKWRTSF
jgi:hypothetical protein